MTILVVAGTTPPHSVNPSGSIGLDALQCLWTSNQCQIYGSSRSGLAIVDTPSVVAVSLGNENQAGLVSENELKAVVDLYVAEGLNGIQRLHSDGALALWDKRSLTLVGVRDRIGVCNLFYSQHSGGTFLSNRLEPTRNHSAAIDPEFVADFVAFHGCSVDRTVWTNSRPVPPGHLLRWQQGKSEIQPYWSPHAIRPERKMPATKAAAEFLELFRSAVKNRMESAESTWCHLSGGLDSSSVTSVAATLAGQGPDGRCRLGGTLTMTDSFSARGELRFAEVVAEKFHVRNARIDDDWPWRDDGYAAPLTDQPARDYPLYARNNVAAGIIVAAGGKTLLSGVGADQILSIAASTSADLVWQREVALGLSELHRWSICRGESLWQNLPERVVYPLFSPKAYRWLRTKKVQLPLWIRPGFANRFDLARRFVIQDFSGTTRGLFYQASVIRSLFACTSALAGWHELRGVAVRHPFTDRRLTEFVLGLRYELRSNSFWHKPLLRAAMAGLLPDEVRKRKTKGVPALRVTWAFRRERPLIEKLLNNSILGDLGYIEPRALLASLDAWASGAHGKDLGHVFSAVALETWLQRRLVGASTTTKESSTSQEIAS